MRCDAMLQSLTTTTHLSPLFLRLPTTPPPLPPLTSVPQTNKHPMLDLNLKLKLKLEREERTVPRAKDKTFNVHVDADVEEDDDDMEERLNQFNREVMRTGLLRECRRRRFRENPREKRMRKHREAVLLRRKRRQHQQKGSFEESGAEDDDMWVFSDETFEQLIEDKEDSNPKLDSYFRDVDGEGTWQFLDGTSQSHT